MLCHVCIPWRVWTVNLCWKKQRTLYVEMWLYLCKNQVLPGTVFFMSLMLSRTGKSSQHRAPEEGSSEHSAPRKREVRRSRTCSHLLTPRPPVISSFPSWNSPPFQPHPFCLNGLVFVVPSNACLDSRNQLNQFGWFSFLSVGRWFYLRSKRILLSILLYLMVPKTTVATTNTRLSLCQALFWAVYI